MKEGKTTLSLAMFVKDEAETLRRAVESVKDVVDEVVIGVDESSSDGTIEIARELADVFYTFKWQGDFSAARNLSLSKCTKDWILILDGHEYLKQEAAEAFRKIFETIPDYVNGVGFRIEMEDGAAGQQYRLIKNGAGWKYHGRVHHQLNVGETDPEGRNWAFRDVVIVHAPTQVNRKERKKQRVEMVFSIMEEELAADPTNVRAAYYLGVMHHEAARFDEAAKYYRQYLKHTKDRGEERYLVNWQLGRCMKALGSEWEALVRFRQCARWV